MIELFDKWVIDVDEKNYILGQYFGKKIKKDSKAGKEKEVDDIRVFGYYMSLSNALRDLGKIIARRKHAEKWMSLAEAVAAIEESNAQVEKLLETIKE